LTNLVSISLLKPHPKNGEYFSAPSPEEREAIKRSIETQGIRDPLKVLPDYTVIAGHVRLEIAKELGIEKVPVEVWDVPPEEAEYLLVADNEERRVCNDPIKKAKRAEFLKRYWGIQKGRPEKMDQNDPFFKSIDDIAKAIGESRGSLKRLLKLNDLIPEFQQLVSQGKLSQIAAYSLAFLPPGEQRQLFDILGETGICGLSVKEAQDLRREIEAERKRAEELARRLAESEKALAAAKEGSAEAARLKAEIDALRKENEELKSQQPEVVEKIVEKVVYKPDPALEAKLHAAREEAGKLKAALEETLLSNESYRTEIKNLNRKKEMLERELQILAQSNKRLQEWKEAVPSIPLKPEFDKVVTLGTDLMLVLEKIVNRPDDIRKFAAAFKTAGVVTQSGLYAEAAAIVSGVDVTLTTGLVISVLKHLAADAIKVAEELEASISTAPRLRVVSSTLSTRGDHSNG
jgi:ParB family chromosome partitioning protein